LNLDNAKWMHASELLATSAIIIFGSVLLRPHCPGSLAQIKSSHSFAKAVHFSLSDVHINLNELLLKDECLVKCIQDGLTCASTRERKRKWAELVLKVDHIQSELELSGLFGDKLLRNVES